MDAMNDAVSALLAERRKFVGGLSEARIYLILSDAMGAACPDCRGIDGHSTECHRARAVRAIENALSAAVWA